MKSHRAVLKRSFHLHTQRLALQGPLVRIVNSVFHFTLLHSQSLMPLSTACDPACDLHHIAPLVIAIAGGRRSDNVKFVMRVPRISIAVFGTTISLRGVFASSRGLTKWWSSLWCCSLAGWLAGCRRCFAVLQMFLPYWTNNVKFTLERFKTFNFTQSTVCGGVHCDSAECALWARLNSRCLSSCHLHTDLITLILAPFEGRHNDS